MFLDEFIKIGNFIFESFLHIWPYLVITIPLAVAINMSGASKYIKRAFAAKPFQGSFELIRKGWDHLKTRVGKSRPAKKPVGPVGSPSETLLQLAPVLQASSLVPAAAGSAGCNSCSPDAALLPIQQILPAGNIGNTSSASCCNSQPPETACCDNATSFKSRLFKETLSATWMVGKFMALAFILEALITFYVPASWITGSLGSQSPLAIFYAALLGVPAYTTSLTALPMVSGLLNQGMNPAAAIAFLIAGPITTLPAMAAVWPLVVRRVFVLYVSFAMVGAVLTGVCYSLVYS